LQKQFGAGDPHAEATRLIRWFAQILRLQLHRKELFSLSFLSPQRSGPHGRAPL
jgi:hypothetical protein